MNFSAKNIMTGLAKSTSLLAEISDKQVREIQDILRSMLVDLSQACTDQGIEFFLCGGSALGARRHQGFIPWDDDLDVAMFRDQWERFKVVFDKCLGHKYVLEGPNYGDKDTKCTWGKMYLKGTRMVEIEDVNAPYECGIFVDIFIVENVSDNKMVRRIDSFVSNFMKVVATSMVYYLYPNDVIKKFYGSQPAANRYYKFRKSLGFIFSWVSHQTWCKWYDRFLARHPDSTTMVTMPTARNHYTGETLRRTTFVPLRKATFEGLSVCVPNDLDAYLTNSYGKDFMQLPPVEKRERHFVVEVKY